MSIDTIILFDITSEEVNPEWLLQRMTATPEFAAAIVEEYRNAWQVKEWKLEKSEALGSQLLGPGGFFIRFGPGTLEMYHMMRFNTFTGDAASRKDLREACQNMARLVGSSRVIYTHELMPHEGQGLLQIETDLRERIGPPADTFEELHNAELFEPRAWYIDTFDDLKAAC